MNLNGVYKRIKANEGAQKTRNKHLSRIEKMAVAVENRFPEVKHIQQIRLKHCQWLLAHWCKASTKKDFRSSLRLLIEALDREQDWRKPLGMAPASAGGRPRDISVVRSRSSKYWMD